MMLNKHDEKDTDDWAEIANWVGGANKDTKHPIQQEIDRMKMKNPQHFDDGGQVSMVPPSEDDLLKAITGGISNSNAGGPPQPVLTPKTPMPPMPAPVVPHGTPPLATGPSSSPIPTPPDPFLGDSDQPYNDKASSILGGLDPAKISQMLEGLRQNSNKSQIGAGIAGLGDAIASVGGNNPNHLGQAEDIIQKNRDFGLKGPELISNAGKEQYGLSQQLQAKDPASPFSHVKQNAERSFLKSVGFTDKDISKIDANSIDGLRTGALTRDDIRQRIQSDTELKKMGFGLQKEQIEATKQNHEQERADAEKKERIEHPILTRIDDAVNAKPHGIPELGQTFNGQKITGVKKIR